MDCLDSSLRWNDGVENRKRVENKQSWHWYGLDFKSPAAAPSIADKAGVFGEDYLSAKSASSASLNFLYQCRKQAVEVLFSLGTFYGAAKVKWLAEKRKSLRQDD